MTYKLRRKRDARRGRSSTLCFAAICTAALCSATLACAPFVAAQNPAPEAKPIVPRIEADPSEALLESGFRDLYELNFQGAREQFLAYQKARPNDPMGKTAEAASCLYEEFNAKGVLTSKFFLDDDTFLGGVDGKVSQNKNPQFLAANQKAREMGRQQLKANSRDPRALLAVTIADGMESDYDEIIERRQLPALSLMRQAESEANTLLAIDPNAQDANVALGASNYVIGSMPAYKRAFLWFGGVHGDKQHGMDLMKMAADNGHYLQPFAKVLLALAYEREHQDDRARVLLSELAAQFPENPLFAREVAILDQKPGKS
jgi:hypothetical protein